MSKLKNYGLWVAVAALVAMVAQDSFGVAPADIERYADAILGILVLAGVVSNPASGKWFADQNGK